MIPTISNKFRVFVSSTFSDLKQVGKHWLWPERGQISLRSSRRKKAPASLETGAPFHFYPEQFDRNRLKTGI